MRDEQHFTIGNRVRKIGSYEGPGIVWHVFPGMDGRWHYIVAHKIEGGTGHFYHIYTSGNLELLPDTTPPARAER